MTKIFLLVFLGVLYHAASATWGQWQWQWQHNGNGNNDDNDNGSNENNDDNGNGGSDIQEDDKQRVPAPGYSDLQAS